MSKLSQCMAKAGLSTDEMEELRAHAVAAGDEKAGAQAYLASIHDDVESLRAQLTAQGHDVTPNRYDPPHPDVVQAVERRRTAQQDARIAQETLARNAEEAKATAAQQAMERVQAAVDGRAPKVAPQPETDAAGIGGHIDRFVSALERMNDRLERANGDGEKPAEEAPTAKEPEPKEPEASAQPPRPADSGVTDLRGSKSNPRGTLRAVEGTGDVKARGLSQGVEAKAIAANLTSGFGDIPEYRQVNWEDQAERTVKLMNDDYERAKAIAMGERLPPSGLLARAVLNGVEARAHAEGDIDTIHKLGTQSHLMEQSTTMGQEIGILSQRNPESPVDAIKDVQDARRNAYAKRNKGANPEKEVQKTVQDIKSEVKKSAAPRIQWDLFVKSITCGE